MSSDSNNTSNNFRSILLKNNHRHRHVFLRSFGGLIRTVTSARSTNVDTSTLNFSTNISQFMMTFMASVLTKSQKVESSNLLGYKQPESSN
jgi:hypothetical protein